MHFKHRAEILGVIYLCQELCDGLAAKPTRADVERLEDQLRALENMLDTRPESVAVAGNVIAFPGSHSNRM